MSEKRKTSGPEAAAAFAAVAIGTQGGAAPPPSPPLRVQAPYFSLPAGPAATQPGIDEINALVGAAEARADTKVATALGEFRTAMAELKGELRGEFKELRAATVSKTTLFLTALTLFGAVAAFVTYGAQLFGQGVDAAAIAESAAEKAADQVISAWPRSPVAVVPAPSPRVP